MSGDPKSVPAGYSVSDERDVLAGHKAMVEAKHGKLIVEYQDGLVMQLNTDIRKRIRKRE